MLALWTPLRAQRPRETGRAVALAGNRIAFATVLALANLRTTLSEAVRWTLVLAQVTGVPSLAGTASVLSIARRIVLALALLIAIGSPAVRWTIDIARLSRVALIATTGLRCNAYTMLASNSTGWYTPISLLVFLVSSATFLQYPLLRHARGFVNDLCLNSIC